ncbi:hypothetical protein [Halodesulfovibrio aestuarii]|uniref:Uncharacterized protein n=1 Tax=Halodesulfovibrio aestuarii TaxID=126333 RepID=A0ABV4JTZ0_9BACT
MTSIWTQTELEAQITLWKQAYTHCAAGKSFTIAGRNLTRQDIGVIRDQLRYLEKELAKYTGAQAGMIFVAGVIPRA